MSFMCITLMLICNQIYRIDAAEQLYKAGKIEKILSIRE